MLEEKKPVKYGVRLKSKRGSEDNGCHFQSPYGWGHRCYGNFRNFPNHHRYASIKEVSYHDDYDCDEITSHIHHKLTKVNVPPDPWDDYISHAEKCWKWQTKNRKQWMK